MISAERLIQLLSYDASTGIFRWKESGKGRKASLLAGRIGVRGYEQICIDYKKYASHRLAWLYVHGEWPAHELDHINGDRTDNRIQNLRTATRADNARNRRAARTNKEGLKGVYRASKNRWRAQIKVGYKQYVLGWFKSPEQAHDAYFAAAQKHFGQFASDGSQCG